MASRRDNDGASMKATLCFPRLARFSLRRAVCVWAGAAVLGLMFGLAGPVMAALEPPRGETVPIGGVELEQLIDESLEPPAVLSPDFAEEGPPPASGEPPRVAHGFGPVAPAARQPAGVLSGRIVFMNGGHGWVYAPDYWRLQRPAPLHDMNEDYGNLDQMNFFAAYCFNAGAVVVPMRPLGRQTNEVVLDNTSPQVTWTGSWANSTSTIYYGAAGAVPYRYAAFAATETATATYTPNIPEAGFYPVYTWVRHGSDRGEQLYRIRHTGGESQVRIPHHMVGNGWVYLGEYYFNAGSSTAAGAVVVSNLRASATGTYVFADAIRFGNGMGSVARGGAVSGYPREDEGTRYWVQNSLGQGQDASLYDGSGNDESDGWSAPPKMSREMNREAAGSMTDRLHINFHSNAGGGRGALGLITSDPTPNQSVLAQLCGKEVNDDLRALGSPPLEVPWTTRSTHTYTGGYSEIDGSLFGYEMDATIIEVAFHDSADDTKILRDPKGRAAIARAALHGVIRYMNRFGGAPLAFPPEPPANVEAHASGGGGVYLSWAPPVSSGGSGAPTGYVIYQSTDGVGFGNPIVIDGTFSRNKHIIEMEPGAECYFRIAAINAAGESFPSEVVGCRVPLFHETPRVLIVNAYDRYDRSNNLRQNVTRQSWARPGPTGAIERVWPRQNNSFDYVVAHGKAVSAFGYAFDSCQNEMVASSGGLLEQYDAVIWACGQESTADETFSAAEQAKIAEYRNGGGHLFVSGSDIAWDLARASGPTAADRAFFSEHLKAGLASDAHGNSGSRTVQPLAGGIFAGRENAIFDGGTLGINYVLAPDVLAPTGVGASTALRYASGPAGAAAVQYDGSTGGGRVVYWGFPFETIGNATTRARCMADTLAFLTQDSFLIPPGAVWRHLDTGLAPNAAWRGPGFDDSAWKSGRGRLGYGGDGERTVVSGGSDPQNRPVSTWFRREFHIADISEIKALRVSYQRDDGLRLWLNGVEMLRDNMPSGPLADTALAAAAIAGDDEDAWVTRVISAAPLVAGTNVLAAEVRQSALNSTDLAFDLRLSASLQITMTYETWRANVFGSDAQDETLAAPEADADRDGVPNLLEYALRGDPLDPGSRPEPRLEWDDDGGVALVFAREAFLRDFNVYVEAAADLAGPWKMLAIGGWAFFWDTAEGVTVEESVIGGVRWTTVREALAAEGAEPPPQRFWRVRVMH